MAESNKDVKLPEEQIDPHESIVFPPRLFVYGFGSAITPKTEWPEAVGLTAEEAETKIKQDMPSAKIHVVPQDSFMTMDYRTDRVRLFVDSEGKIVRPPRTG